MLGGEKQQSALQVYFVLVSPVLYYIMAFPGGTVGKDLPASAGDIRDVRPIHGSGRSPGRGNSNPLHYSYLENLMDRGAWQASVHGGHRRVGHN